MVNHCKADRFTTQDHSQHKEIKPLSLSPKSKRTTEVWIHFLWDFWLFRKTTQAYQLQCKSFLQATVFFCNWATSRGIIQGWHACFNDFCHEENPSPSFVDGMLVSRSQSPSDRQAGLPAQVLFVSFLQLCGIWASDATLQKQFQLNCVNEPRFTFCFRARYRMTPNLVGKWGNIF